MTKTDTRRWMVEGMLDGQTHYAVKVKDGAAKAACGLIFHPIVTLLSDPPDPDQVCRKCERKGRVHGK